MGCERFRDALSARLDGEDDPAERAEVDAHLAGCSPCRRWLDDAASITRLARTSIATTSPAISDEVLAAAPGPTRRRVASACRAALGLVGLAQFMLGMAQVSVFSASTHDHEVVSSAHLWHESAAWNVAIGAGFGWIALRRSRPAGLIPSLTAFVTLLTLLSVNDLITSRVDATRLFSHALVIAGYLIVLLITHPSFDFGDPPTGRQRPARRWSVRFDDDARWAPTSLRGLPGRLPPHSAEHTTRQDRAA